MGVVGVGVEGEPSASALRLKFAKPLDHGVVVAGAVKDGMRKGRSSWLTSVAPPPLDDYGDGSAPRNSMLSTVILNASIVVPDLTLRTMPVISMMDSDKSVVVSRV